MLHAHHHHPPYPRLPPPRPPRPSPPSNPHPHPPPVCKLHRAPYLLPPPRARVQSPTVRQRTGYADRERRPAASRGFSLLRQLRLPLLGAWALTSSGRLWAGRTGRPQDSPCRRLHLISDSDSYATRAADGRGGYATTYLRPRDPLGTAGCGRADGATRRCTTPKAHPAVLTQRGPDYGPGAYGSRAAHLAVLTKPGPRAGSVSAGAA
jgi:hypothetical protein